MEPKDENLVFRESGHPSQLARELDELRRNGEFCDVKILIEERSFLAHRCVLSASCTYFKHMFSSGMKESTKDEVEIFGISASIFDIMLSYIYTGNVIVDLGDIQDLIVAANMFQISSLKDACSSYLKKRIDCQNCIGLFEFGEIYDCPELRRLSKLFIMEHFVDVFTTENDEFLNLGHKRLSELLNDEDLKVESEDQILNVALQWLLNNVESNMKHSSAILSTVRFPLLPEVKISDAIKECKMQYLHKQSSISDALAKIELTCKNFRKLQITVKYNTSVRKGAMKFIYIIGGYRSPHGISWLSGDCLSTVEKYDFEAARSKCSLPQMHEAKRSHSCAVIGGAIYVFGGENDCMLSNSIEKYDPHLRKWVNAGVMESPRCGFGIAVIDDKAFLIGGCIGSKLSKDIDRYDVKTSCMEKVGELQAEKTYFGYAVCQGNVYISGGVDKFDDFLSTTEMFDPFPYGCRRIAQLKTEHDDGEITHAPLQIRTQSKAKMATARSNHSLVSLNDFIFSVGGQSSPKYTLRLVDRYDPKSDIWETVTLLPDPRSHVAAVVHQEKIYVIGGRDHNGNTLKTLVCFTPDKVKWSNRYEIDIDRCDMTALVL